MNRIEELEEKITALENKSAGKKPKFTLPFKARSAERKASKKSEFIFVEYLTMKGEIEFKVERVVSGNIVVIRNKAYVVNPKRTYRYGKHLWYIIQEFNRYPISNENYDEVKARREDTDADVPLIKAVLAAQQKPQLPGGKSAWIIIGLVVVGIFLLWRFMPK